MYDAWRETKTKGYHPSLGVPSYAVMFFGQRMQEWEDSNAGNMESRSELLQKDVRPVDLKSREHSAEVLEWATEVVSAAMKNVMASKP